MRRGLSELTGTCCLWGYFLMRVFLLFPTHPGRQKPEDGETFLVAKFFENFFSKQLSSSCTKERGPCALRRHPSGEKKKF